MKKFIQELCPSQLKINKLFSSLKNKIYNNSKKIMKCLKSCGIWKILMIGVTEYRTIHKNKSNFITRWFQNLTN